MDNFDEILNENRRRNALRRQAESFDPVRGDRSSGERVPAGPYPWTDGVEHVPREMTADPLFTRVTDATGWARLRCRYDFEYWAARCCRIKDKETGRVVPFILNRPQRRVVAMLEEDRRAGRPMRMIILKARQWGGSTVTELYMAWIQTCLRDHCHAIVCGAERTGTQVVLNLYADMLLNYPPELWEGETPPRLKTSRGILELQGRDNRIYLAASTNPNAVRGADAALVHLTEVAFWKSTRGLDPWDAVRAIYCSVALAPMTMIVMESTADGVGSFFHEEWLRARSGRSDNRAVFVPWHEIGKYSLPFACEADARRLWESLDTYELALWTDTRLTLEQIHWYHRRRREMKEHAKMKSEFPSTADEAFACTSSTVFAPDGVKRLRQDCREPVAIGEVVSDTGAVTGPQSLAGLRFAADPTGGLHVWQFPEDDASYVASVDVGGLSDTADWSVILVLRRGPRPEVVAQWRGHIDHDLLVWKAARVAAYFNRACLVFESNTLESGRGHNAEAPYAQGALILNELYEHYPNLYRRPSAAGGMPRQAAVTGLSGSIPGFHTNRQTKQLIITRLIAAVRDGLYTERCSEACDELDCYERLPSGAYAARPPHHDDMLMTRAIGLHICSLPDDTATDAATARYLSRFRY